MYGFRKIKRNNARILQRNRKSSVININEYADVDTHWIALFCNRSGIVLKVLNMFLKKLKNLLGIKT